MQKLILILATAMLINGCAHKDLKAPCTDNQFASRGDVPCHQRQAVNVAWLNNYERYLHADFRTRSSCGALLPDRL